MTRTTLLAPRRARQALLALFLVAGVTVTGYGAQPALAGQPLTYDHMAARPRLNAPESVARDDSGNILVAEANVATSATDDRLVKFDPDGTFLDVIAGPGTAAGSLANPMSVAVAPTAGHNLYVVENGSSVSGGVDRISFFSPGGNYLGSWGTTGSGNGSFNDARGIAIDSTGNVYVADYGNDRVQVFDSAGTWQAAWSVSNASEIAVDASDRIWIASSGTTVSRYSAAGALGASWPAPGAEGIDIDTDGNVWVSSTAGAIREYTASGTLLSTVGSGEVSPTVSGLVVAPNSVYVADTGNHRIARFALPPTSTSWAAPGVTGLSSDGTTLYATDGTNANTYSLSGVAGTAWGSNGGYSVAVDGANVWVSSVTDGVVREYDASGNLLATVGTGTLSAPRGLAVAGGKLYVADTGNGKIVRFTAATGAFDTQWSVTGGVTGVAVGGTTVFAASSNTIRSYTTAGAAVSSWASSGATDLTVDGSGNIWVSSTDGVVREYTSSRVLIATIGSGTLSSTPVGVAVAGGRLYVGDTGDDRVVRFSFASFDTDWGAFPGPGVEDSPSGIATDASNNVYVTDKFDDTIQKFDAGGTYLTAWGQDGTANDLVDPGAIAVAPSGLVYVADTGNDRIEVFDQDGVYQNQWGSFGSNASLRQMDAPSGVAIDPSGNVYVADLGNDRITKFTSGGTYITTWGTLGTGNAQFSEPRGVAIDQSGHVWVADSKNNRVQEFAADGTYLNKWGGSGAGGVSASSNDGKLNKPYDLDFDAEGTVWVADNVNHRVQRLTTAGVFLSKLGSQGLDIAQFNTPSGIAIDGTGHVSVADTKNNRVQVFVDQNGPDTTISTGPGTVSSSTTAQFTFSANEPGATFECTIDGGGSGPWASCASGDQYTGMSEGTHTFYVHAKDAGDNVGDPATYEWSVDLTAPTVSIDTSPSSPTKSTTASFTYHSSEGGTTFLCSLDSATPASCGASFSGPVANGDHTFDVWAVDAAGNQSTNPAQATWTVDTTPPVVHITDGPSGWVQSTNATFDLASPDPGATFECHLDSAQYAACTSPASYSSLAEGLHTFYVRATDALGNVSADATQQWTVDLATHRPDAWIGYGGKYVGNDVFGSSGIGETKTAKVKAGTTVSFTIRIENDGSATDTFSIQGGGPAKGYKVTYLSGTTDDTAKIVNGNLNLTIGAGSYRSLTLRVAVGSSGKASWSSLVTITAIHQPSRSDAVKAVVKRT